MGRYKTPLRYPGGKQRVWPFVADLMKANNLDGGNYVEPYAGGAGIALELLMSGIASKLYLNDSSYPVYAFWRSVVEDSEQLCKKISRASITVKEWKLQKDILTNYRRYSRLEVGYSMFYLNRCNRSGILSAGLIGGLEQKGNYKMDARFTRVELIRRIQAIARFRSQIIVRNMDAESFLRGCVSKLPGKTLVYCDPPYFQKGNRLYLDHYEEKDHKRIARYVQSHLKKKWIVSYDRAGPILSFYKMRRSLIYRLQYNAGNVYRGAEVFFFSDNLLIPNGCRSMLSARKRDPGSKKLLGRRAS